MSDRDKRPPTAQRPNAAGPGNKHYGPPRAAPGPWGTGEKPFHPEGDKPVADPAKAAEEVLRQAKDSHSAAGDAGPEAAGKGAADRG